MVMRYPLGNTPQVLEGLKLTPKQFVDLCILCGCDYVGTIDGAGSSLPAIFGLAERQGMS